MEVTLQDLIESIKKDGVETAEQRAEEIIQAANNKAESIISEAQGKAAKMILDAEKTSKMKEQSSISSVIQASRDLLLSLQKEITAIFSLLLQKRLGKEFNNETLLVDLIKDLMKSDLISSKKEEIQLP